MCGITGFWQFNKQSFSKPYDQIALEMAEQINFRGPDDQGSWMDQQAGISFGHRRLSVVDLSEAGHQPMHSHSGRLTMVYNGEVYNANEIKEELGIYGKHFRGHSDTEIMLEAIEIWGLFAAVKKFIGMFAFALWDHEKQKLFLVRDRLGIKPLYYGMNNKTFFFGSQMKSFTPHPHWSPQICKTALTSYFRFGYVPAPLSIYQNISKQKPGSILEVDSSGEVHETFYWDFREIAYQKFHDRLDLSDLEATNQLETLLKDAVAKRMIADVPLGAFLSGGVDSSAVVALMQIQSSKPIKTFSIGFEEEGYNEATHAKEVAKHLKTEHHELYVTSHKAQAVIPKLSQWFDEPFSDSSQIPTQIVSEITRNHVTIALSGDGGDELFAGYNRYFVGESIWRKIAPIPTVMKKIGRMGINLFSPGGWDLISTLIPKKYRPQHFGDKIYKLAEVLPYSQLNDFYKILVSQWRHPLTLVQGGKEVDLWQREGLTPLKFSTNCEIMQFMDIMTYLPDDILTKVDRASMAVSLEARVPLLDHRVVEFAWSLPEKFKIRGSQSKWLLRQVLYRHVPKIYIERPKMGFGVPVGEWIKGPLKDWAEDLLSKEALESSGLFCEPIIIRWHEHLKGIRNWQDSLWTVLMYQSWFKQEKFSSQ